MLGIRNYFKLVLTSEDIFQERPHHSLNKKSPLQYFCGIMNSRKSEFSQTGITYTLVKTKEIGK